MQRLIIHYHHLAILAFTCSCKHLVEMQQETVIHVSTDVIKVSLNPPTEEQRDGDAPALRLPGGAEPVGGGRTGP